MKKLFIAFASFIGTMYIMILAMAMIAILLSSCSKDEALPTYTFSLTELSNGQIGITYQSNTKGWKILIGECEEDVSGETSFYMFHDDNMGCSNMKHDRISTPMYFRAVSDDGSIDETKKI